MASPRRSAVLLSVALLGAAAGLVPSPAHATTAVPLARFGAALIPGLATFSDHGAISATLPMTLSLDLRRPNPAGETAFVNTVEAKHSTVKPLSVAQFAARFGVAQSTFDEAKTYATAHGLTVDSASPARDHLVLSGTAAQVEKTFATPLHSYVAGKKSFYANTVPPLLPSDLPVIALLGLETAHHATVASPHTHPRQDLCSNGQCLGDVTPQDLWSIYDEPSDITGKGQKLAIFGEGATQYVIDDLRQFEKENHLPTIPVTVDFADGPDKGQYTSKDGDGEWQLDTQSSSGMAYDADELDMEWGKDLNDASTMNVLEEWENDPQGSYAASASYSECEPTVGDPGGAEAMLPSAVTDMAGLYFSTDAYTSAYEAALTKAVAMGKTLFSSSGDTGSSCGALPADLNGVTPTEGNPGVGFPGSSPHAVDVGGTVLYGTENTAPTAAKDGASNAKRSQEYGWTSSGGGPSEVFPAPKYQDGVVADNAPTETPDVPCLSDLTGAPDTTGETCRKLPDVSTISGDIVTNGYNIVDDKADSATGGTSLSSPVMLGLWTRVQSKVGGVGLGYANPVFYAHPDLFFDPGAAAGTPYTPSGSTVPSTNGFVSGPGFDYVTGLGVMDVAAFIKAVAPTVTPVAAAPSPTPTATAAPAPSSDATAAPVAASPDLPRTGLDPWLAVAGLLTLSGGAWGLRRHRAL